jgi:hypothetical protein
MDAMDHISAWIGELLVAYLKLVNVGLNLAATYRHQLCSQSIRSDSFLFPEEE